MKTFDTAETINDLTDYYCMRCVIGLSACIQNARDCNKIKSDRDYEYVIAMEELPNDN